MVNSYARNMTVLLYFLHGLPDVYQQDKYIKLARYLENNYQIEELVAFSETIKAALDDPGYDFKNVDQGLPHKTEDIQYFLKKVKQILHDVVTTKYSDS